MRVCLINKVASLKNREVLLTRIRARFLTDIQLFFSPSLCREVGVAVVDAADAMAPQARKIIFRAVKRIKKVESSVVRDPKEEALASKEEEHAFRRAVSSFVSSGITVRVPSHKFVGLAIVWKFAESLESYINEREKMSRRAE